MRGSHQGHIRALQRCRFRLTPTQAKQCKGTDQRWVLLAIGVLLLQLAFTYAPPLQTLFGTEVLSLTAWSVAATVAASVLVLVELEKYVVRRRKTPPQSRADTEKVDSRQHADPG